MPLIPVAPVVLLLQRIRPGVPEREWIPLVVVVRLVERQGVIQLELQPRTGRALQLRGDSVVARPGGALHHGQGSQTGGPARGEVGVPRTRVYAVAEYRVVGVEEASQVIGPRMRVAEPGGNPGSDLPFIADRCGEGPRILEILVEHEHAGLEGTTRGGGQQL